MDHTIRPRLGSVGLNLTQDGSQIDHHAFLLSIPTLELSDQDVYEILPNLATAFGHRTESVQDGQILIAHTKPARKMRSRLRV